MRLRGVPFQRLAVPVKGLVQRFAFLLLVTSAAALMVLSTVDSTLVQGLRTGITDVAAPVLNVLSRPLATAADVIEAVDEFLHMRSENARLSEDNRRLLHWEAVARRLESENVSLRAMLNTVPEPRAAFVTARVIADSGSAFVRTVLVNAGAREGVAKGQAAITADGLVGRVVEVGTRSARILLLTDLNSRVPVVVEPTRTPAVLAGDNTDLPRLTFLPDGARVRAGERIVTSGQGGVLPPGLPIGVVESLAEGEGRVQPFVDWHRLNYVRVLDYPLAGVLPKTREAGRAGPLW